MKKLLLILLILALMLCLCACGEPQSPEDRARQFLSALLADDAELQQALLDNVTVIGIGVPAPTEEELAERTEREAAITQMLHDRFDGLASPELIDKNATDGQLTYWQTLLSFNWVKVTVTDFGFLAPDEHGREVFEATLHCVRGCYEEKDLPLKGYLSFDEDGLIDSFHLYEEEAGSLTGWLMR
ncbi:MAG: hypothetical protein IJH56_01560 [Firmicutes bacterium]|nr:hypothetical protein [Bacillota bacterium]